MRSINATNFGRLRLSPPPTFFDKLDISHGAKIFENATLVFQIRLLSR
jgi:hypothetical protein